MRFTTAFLLLVLAVFISSFFALWLPVVNNCCGAQECAIQHHHDQRPGEENYVW